MAQPTDLVSGIVARLQTVTAIGNVYARHPLWHDDAAARTVLAYTVPGGSSYAGQVVARAWFVSLDRTEETVLSTESRRRKIVHEVLVRGYHGIMDAAVPSSEEVFRNLAEAALAEFRRDLTMGGSVDTTDPPSQTWGHASLPTGLCHATEIRIRGIRYPLISLL